MKSCTKDRERRSPMEIEDSKTLLNALAGEHPIASKSR